MDDWFQIRYRGFMAAVFSYLKEKKWFAVSGNRPVCPVNRKEIDMDYRTGCLQTMVPDQQRVNVLSG